jgi:hypothetical protein
VPSAARLIDETLGLLQSFSQDSEQVTTLGTTMGAGDLTFNVTTIRSGAMGLSPGVVEIDSELIYCQSVANDGTAIIPPWGRGHDGTTPAAHTSGVKVISQPTYPRAKVLDALNEAIARVYPSLFVMKVATLTTTSPAQSVTYDLPEDAVWVWDARWQPPTGTKYWQSVRRWRVGQGGTTVLGDLGVSVDVADAMTPGQPIEFTYAARPTLLASEADDFVGVTGLPLSAKDLIVTGAACGNLVPSQELSRLQTSSVEQQNRAGLVAPSAALTSSRYLEAKFQQRLQEESRALRAKYPLRLARSWT